MNILEDESSTSSSSSSSSGDMPSNIINPDSPSQLTPISHKRKAGRKKFQETRHPIYRGVRRRNGNKWVCEVREPHKKSRIWLGTFTTPEMAGRAHDVAALALRGELAALNFADSAWLLPRPKSSSAKDIQMAALEASKAFLPPTSSSSSSFDFSKALESSLVVDLPHVKSQEKVLESSSIDSQCVKSSQKAPELSTTSAFLDEEALFNMPGLLDSMAEGLILTPLAMKRGYNWDDVTCDMDFNLWSSS